jgi:hypothetical protein
MMMMAAMMAQRAGLVVAQRARLTGTTTTLASMSATMTFAHTATAADVEMVDGLLRARSVFVGGDDLHWNFVEFFKIKSLCVCVVGSTYRVVRRIP